MGQGNSDLLVENENLFRALICAPLAVLFSMLTVYSFSSASPIVMSIIFVLAALYFVLATLSYAANFTNELYEKGVENVVENLNLFYALVYTPLAVLSLLFAYSTFMYGGHVFFKVIIVLLSSYFTLRALAYASFYTNDYFESQAH